jgi:hypothetical protein
MEKSNVPNHHPDDLCTESKVGAKNHCHPSGRIYKPFLSVEDDYPLVICFITTENGQLLANNDFPPWTFSTWRCSTANCLSLRIIYP